MSCGIHPDEKQIELFNEVKISKKFRALVLALNKDRNGLDTIATLERENDFNDLKTHLPDNDCRFVVYDFEFETFENPPRKTSKLLLICWVPDYASVKVKVPFSSSKSDLKANFPGIQKDILATDFALLEYEDLRKECSN